MDNKELVKMLAEDCVQVEDRIYFVSKDINLVCYLDLISGEVQIVDSIPEEDILASRLGAKIVYWKNELIFAPMNARKIWIYNLDTKNWHGIERKDMGRAASGIMFQAVLYGDKLFIIGSDYPAIICLDLLSEQMVYAEEPYERLKTIKEQIGDVYFRCNYVQRGAKIYLASCLDNFVLEFDMETLNYQWIEVGNSQNRYAGITWDGNNFWLAPRKNTNIVKWNGEDLVVEFSLPKGFEQDIWYFLGAVYNGDRIILPGMSKNCTMEIVDLQEGNRKLIEKQYSFYNRVDNQLVVGQTIGGIIEISNGGTETVCFRCGIDRKKIEKYFAEKKLNLAEHLSKGVHNENSVVDVTEFYRAGINRNSIKGKKESQGEKIWKKLRA